MALPAENRLLADGLCKSYRGRRVVENLTLALEPGEVVGLLGPNGAGKTTTFHMLVGLVRPDSGRVLLDGKDVTRLPVHRRALAGIGFLSQEPSVFRDLTAQDNLRLVLEVSGVSGREAQRRAAAILEELDLQTVARVPASRCSGGERRRLEIARALVGKPRFMLLDEPFSGIDPLALQDIRSQIKLLADKGLGLLVTDHNVAEALATCKRAIIISAGRVVASGTPGEIAADPLARHMYLGENFTWREAAQP